jgi:hypothetical protein
LQGFSKSQQPKKRKPQVFDACGFCLNIKFSAQQADPYNNTKNKIRLFCKKSFVSPVKNSSRPHIFFQVKKIEWNL